MCAYMMWHTLKTLYLKMFYKMLYCIQTEWEEQQNTVHHQNHNQRYLRTTIKTDSLSIP